MKITKKDLIKFCRRRDSEICTQCEHYEGACRVFKSVVGEIPYFADKKEFTDEVIEVSDGNGNCK